MPQIVSVLILATIIAPAARPIQEEGLLEDVEPLEDEAFLEQARRYTRGNYGLYLLDFVWTGIVLAIMAFSGLAHRLWTWLRERAGEGARSKLIFIALFVLAISAATLPIDYYAGYVREHAYGFSTQTAEGWIADRVAGAGISILIVALFVIPLYAIIRRYRSRWWIPGSILTGFFMALMVLATPVLLDPVFNDFLPVPDDSMKARILEMAAENGIEAGDVFVMDASSRSVHDNAYVTGLLGTQRIVLYDTLLSSYRPDEIEFILGHEIGHYVLGHLWLGLGLGLVLVLAGFRILAALFEWSVARFGRWSGYRDPSDLSTLPLLALAASLTLFLLLPSQTAGSRWMEREADRFALDHTDDPSAGARAFRRMARRNLSDPDPPGWIEWLLYTHPPMRERIERAEAAARERAPGSRS